MTVVACLISQTCTTHTSDSLLTRPNANGSYDELEWQEPKLIPVERFGGALAYYGFAGMSMVRSTRRWLQAEAALAHLVASAEELAGRIATRAEVWLRTEGAPRDARGGLGIHFTAYEWCEGYWVPELFHITNWADPTYTALKPQGVSWSRNSYPTIVDTVDVSLPVQRAVVRQFLAGGGFLRFNNGDPQMYNGLANAIHDAGGLVLQRLPGGIAGTDAAKWRSLARRPVELVASLQQDLAGPGRRAVGGRIHDLTITPPREMSSTTGVV